MNNAGLVLGKKINALDGEIGVVTDLYFEHQTWSVRYLVVETGKRLLSKTVLLAPEAIVKPWHHESTISAKLTTDQIRSSPDIDLEAPVSRAAEELLHRHYQWTPYWDSTVELSDTGLRSANELGGYQVNADDGEVGRLVDLVLDDDLSRILFLVVEVKGWFSAKKVLAAPRLITNVDWAGSTVHVSGNRQALKSSQEYNPAA